MICFLERNDDVMSIKHTILSWLGGVPRSKVIFLTAERDYAREQVEEYKKDLVAAREVIEQLRDKIKSTKLTSNH